MIAIWKDWNVWGDSIDEVQICWNVDCRELLEKEFVCIGIARGLKMAALKYGRTES